MCCFSPYHHGSSCWIPHPEHTQVSTACSLKVLEDFIEFVFARRTVTCLKVDSLCDFFFNFNSATGLVNFNKCECQVYLRFIVFPKTASIVGIIE